MFAMMESIVLDSSSDDADSDWERIDAGYDAPQTPSSTGDEAPPRPSFATGASDAESDEDDPAHGHGELVPRRKPGGYDSRIEQILYENPELPLLITDAGKSMESGGRYIVYTIRTGVSWPGAASARREIANCPARISKSGGDTRSSPP